MVQVDFFWSFAAGAGLAATAARQLKNEDKPFENKYFTRTMIFLSCLWVPITTLLLWGFPEWESMQVGTYETIPAWFVGLFALLNVTQGILGFWIAYKFIRKGNFYVPYLMMLSGYFIMFFLITHGWDGTGYQRFLYSCTGWGDVECVPWQPGLWSFKTLFVSPVAWTLYAVGALFLPVLFNWMLDAIKSGYDYGEVDNTRALETTKIHIATSLAKLIMLHTFWAAITASILVWVLGWWIGGAIFFPALYLLLLRKGGLTYQEVGRITLQDD
jgi:hypothetical protein